MNLSRNILALSILTLALLGCQVVKPISADNINSDYLGSHLNHGEWTNIITTDGKSIGGKFMFLDESTITVKGTRDIPVNVQYSNIAGIYTRSNRLLYEVEVIKMDGTRLNGLLNEVHENKLVIHDIQFNHIEVYPQDIKQIRIRSIKKQKIAMAAGGLAGMIAGFVIGVNQVEPSDCQGFSCIGSGVGDANESMAIGVGFGIGLGIVGGAVGALAGSTKISVIIDGSNDVYLKNQNQLNRYIVPPEYYE